MVGNTAKTEVTIARGGRDCSQCWWNTVRVVGNISHFQKIAVLILLVGNIAKYSDDINPYRLGFILYRYLMKNSCVDCGTQWGYFNL